MTPTFDFALFFDGKARVSPPGTAVELKAYE